MMNAIETGEASAPPPRSRVVPVALIGLTAAIVLAGTALLMRAEARTNKVALASAPRPVSVIEAQGATYRKTRSYVGTLEAWQEADVGPQLVSAYVDAVLVRPGSIVKKGDVLATLDCRNANAGSQAVAAQARALDARMRAMASETARYRGLLDGGYVAPNEVEQRTAATSAQEAEIGAARARLLGTALQVNDCILRSPFDGEVATRSADPGAFVRPGTAIATVVDRTAARLVVDVPEVDFPFVSPGTEARVTLLATKRTTVARISRRTPAADAATRTVRFEIDLPDPERQIPVGTTGEVRIEIGEPVQATALPAHAGTVRNGKVTVYMVEGDVAHARVVPLLGEAAGQLYLDTKLAPGSRIVTEGRALLSDGDRVAAKVEAPAAPVPEKKP